MFFEDRRYIDHFMNFSYGIWISISNCMHVFKIKNFQPHGTGRHDVVSKSRRTWHFRERNITLDVTVDN